MTRPPRLATRLLLWRLHPDERDELVGDLNEQFARRVERDGARPATRWYWRQSLSLAWGFFVQRRDEVSTHHERHRGRWFLNGLAHDCRDAIRGLRHSPAYTLIALTTIAFGVGLATAVFSLVHGVLLQPLPYPEADRLVRLAEFTPGSALSRLGAAPPGVEDSGGTLGETTIGQWSSRTTTLDALVPVSTSGRNVVTADGSEQVIVAQVGARFFDVLGQPSSDGRLLQAADDAADAPDVAVVSDRLAQRLPGDPATIVGRVLTLDGDPFTVVGVSAPLDIPAPEVDVWIAGRWTFPAPGVRRQFSMSLETFGRMRTGVSVDDVQLEGEQVAIAIASAHPDFFDGTVTIPTIRVRPLLDDVVGPFRPAMVVLALGMAMVLLAACVSLANLVLTRTTARRRDVAVRSALGASSIRLLRPVLFEQLVLAAVGSGLGALIAWWSLRALPLVAPADLPRLAEVGFDPRSLALAVAAATMTAIFAALAPIWRRSGRGASTGLNDGLRARAGGAPGDRIRSALVVCQVGLAAALLVGAALVGRSLVALLEVDSGYRAAGVLTFQISVPDGWWQQKGRQTEFVNNLLQTISGRPDVVAAGVSSTLPMRMAVSRGTFWIVGRPRPTDPAERPAASNRVISPGYLEAVGTPLRRGRAFTDADVLEAERVLIIDEVLADRYFPGEDPIGQRLVHVGGREWTIVGVASAVHDRGPGLSADPTIYMPAAQLAEILAFNSISAGLAVRTTGDPMGLASFVREQARALEPLWPVFQIEQLDDRFGDAISQPRFYAVALGLFATLALVTAALGVYGVLAYAVERRRLEFSIRRALGATEAGILRLVIGRAVGLAGLGLIVGLGAAAGGGSVLRSQLFGIEPLDAASFILAAGLLIAIVLLASWWPARRATGANPVDALKAD